MPESNIPNHIAIIPDGNRRWAKKRGLKPWLGHEAGADGLLANLQAALDMGIPYITFWAASIDNLTKRGKLEVKFLLRILKNLFDDPKFTDFFHKNGVKIQVLGEWEKIIKDDGLKISIKRIQEETHGYRKAFLTILLAYDGQVEMLQAIEAAKHSRAPLTKNNFRPLLLTGHLPDIDLVIRTGGQPHWSAGFMMWLTANSEFYFTQTLYPDFKPAELRSAVKDYQTRLRKMGK